MRQGKFLSHVRYFSVTLSFMSLHKPRRPLSDLSGEELRERAQQHRDMAATARQAVAYNGLLKLASRLDALADAKEAPAARA
jgi:hypothetical protein